MTTDNLDYIDMHRPEQVFAITLEFTDRDKEHVVAAGRTPDHALAHARARYPGAVGFSVSPVERFLESRRVPAIVTGDVEGHVPAPEVEEARSLYCLRAQMTNESAFTVLALGRDEAEAMEWARLAFAPGQVADVEVEDNLIRTIFGEADAVDVLDRRRRVVSDEFLRLLDDLSRQYGGAASGN